MRSLVVLGGSSPFSAALVNALARETASVPPCRLVLHGRDVQRLEAMRHYAHARLAPRGWSCMDTRDLDQALEGAWVVLNQIRFGGLAGRAEDEALAVRFGQPPDETLGIGALHRALEAAPELRRLGARLRARCPTAWVLNLTNPLSLATSILVEAGVARCVGLCELPLVTAERAACLLGQPLDALDWAYVGLNHRGFIVRLEHDGRDQLGPLVDAVGASGLEGIRSEEIRELGAVPTKYFRLLAGRGSMGAGRAARLASLGGRIEAELARRPDRSPPSLVERYTEWYPRSVVPIVVALSSDEPSGQVVNVTDETGITREVHARVSSHGVDPTPSAVAGSGVRPWLARFERHERAMLDAVRDPTPGTVRTVLELDPLGLETDHVTAATEALLHRT